MRRTTYFQHVPLSRFLTGATNEKEAQTITDRGWFLVLQPEDKEPSLVIISSFSIHSQAVTYIL